MILTFYCNKNNQIENLREIEISDKWDINVRVPNEIADILSKNDTWESLCNVDKIIKTLQLNTECDIKFLRDGTCELNMRIKKDSMPKVVTEQRGKVTTWDAKYKIYDLDEYANKSQSQLEHDHEQQTEHQEDKKLPSIAEWMKR